ncbi:MAG: RNA 3'-terminal phosphate cyclase, partial [Planctomycetes bacterium]|nr:RNA 3'-terminal phosphate cyclase [Planctomycetota bacterium]
MIAIDGSRGEGGGQVLRTALSLSLVTGKPFRIEKVRARRERPGLLRQHLTAVGAAAEICRAEVRGAEPGSSQLVFEPGKVEPGVYSFAVGTAGSTTLVLQTVLPALMTASGPSTVALEGGTHNPLAPPFDFLERAFLPLVARMGPGFTARLERPGFFPAGGGRCTVSVTPAPALGPLRLLERGAVRSRRARALVANLPRHIGERELRAVSRSLGWQPSELEAIEVPGSRGPGNAVVLEIVCEQVTEVFTGFGERGVPAEKVAEAAAGEARAYLESGAPVGPHLADQLLLPLA